MEMEAILKAVWESGAIWKLGIAIAPLVWASVTKAQWAKAATNRTILDCVEAATVAVYHRIVRPKAMAEIETGGVKIKIGDTQAEMLRKAARRIAGDLAAEQGVDLSKERRDEFLDAMIERTIQNLKSGKNL